MKYYLEYCTNEECDCLVAIDENGNKYVTYNFEEDAHDTCYQVLERIKSIKGWKPLESTDGLTTLAILEKEMMQKIPKIAIYQNKRNEHKFIEIHNDGHYHNSVRQFLQWSNGVKNFTGDGFLHRWRRPDLNELLTDYTLVQAAE